MSQIDKLIADLCPDGVEFKRIADVSSKGSKIKWAQVGNAEYQYIDPGAVEPRTRQIGKTHTINSCNAPSRAQQIVHSGDIIFATTRPTQLRWAVIPDSYDGQVVSTGYCVIRPDRSSIITNYLAHTLGTTSFLKYLKANQILGNYPSIPDSRIQEFRIPVPPLEVQREITRVLDKFTQVEAELEAELEARRRQYDMARRTLLGKCKKSPILSLGKACSIKAGNLISKSVIEKSPGPYPVINSGREPLGFTSLYNTEDNPLGITSRGAGVGSVTWCLGRYFRGSLNYSVTIREPRILDTRFLFHTLNEYQKEIKSLCTFEGIPALNKKNLEKLEIPAPSLDIQKEVALTLDKLEVFVNDLSVGLPAELAARRKQYEYYRDRLLTFEEKR